MKALFPLLVLLPLAAAAAGYPDLKLEGIPHVRQKPDFCGEACVEMYLRKLGLPVDQDRVFTLSGLDPALGRGCYTRELAPALRRLGFDPGNAATWVKAGSDKELDKQFAALIADLKAGHPSIVCMHYSDRPDTTEHFRLITGYRAASDEVIYHEPAEADGAYRRMKRKHFLKLWPLKYHEDRWLVVRMPLAGTPQIPVAKAEGFQAADFAQHVRALKKRLPGKGFHIVVQPPFVVVGDESAERVKQRSLRTIKWSVDLLKKDFFDKDPEAIIDVWLFKDKRSYEDHVKALWGSRPGTPYGYYSSEHRALIMNISTGGGTLVHEIVHPFIESNFPQCPSWFNEGLASLYEQCSYKDDRISGLTNWRLAGLQKIIRKKACPSFSELCGTTRDGFYHSRAGHYAQARYLCYYLQEQHKLRKFYHAFRKNVDEDPTGYQTLQEILGEKDMAVFQKEWEAWVLKLKYP